MSCLTLTQTLEAGHMVPVLQMKRPKFAKSKPLDEGKLVTGEKSKTKAYWHLVSVCCVPL